MLVTCPSCEAKYELGLQALGAGRRLRCARCKADWFVEGAPEPIVSLEEAASIDAVDSPETAAATPVMDAEQVAPVKRRRQLFRRREPRPERAPVASARTRRRPTFRTPAFVRPASALAAACVACLAVIVVERAPIVRAAPSLASLYALVGLDVNVRGLDIRDVRSLEQVDEGVPQLLVTGRIANVSDGPIDVPRLRLAVTSGDEREIYAWTTVAARPKLSPGEEATFRARLASPPAEGHAVAVRFLARQDLAARASR